MSNLYIKFPVGGGWSAKSRRPDRYGRLPTVFYKKAMSNKSDTKTLHALRLEHQRDIEQLEKEIEEKSIRLDERRKLLRRMLLPERSPSSKKPAPKKPGINLTKIIRQEAAGLRRFTKRQMESHLKAAYPSIAIKFYSVEGAIIDMKKRGELRAVEKIEGGANVYEVVDKTPPTD
jgi:hypothetical protein